MEVRRWIDGDETAKEMLERVFIQRPNLALPPPLHRIPLRSGNVVEVAGPSPSAKTQILLQAAVNCVLPKEWKGTYYGGLGQIVHYIDLECIFDAQRLLELLKHRIMGANGHLSSGCVEEIISVCMERFFYTRCYDSFEFLATLKTLHYRLQKEKLALENCGHVLVMDSIGAFHWVDRACTSYVLEGHNRKSISFQNVMEIVVGDLRKLLSVHSVVVICTKTTILRNGPKDGNYIKRSAPDNPDSLRDVGDDQRPVCREYMPSIWQSLVTHRIFVQASDDQVAVKHGGRVVYASDWSLPCLSFSDEFVVTDTGITLVNGFQQEFSSFGYGIKQDATEVIPGDSREGERESAEVMASPSSSSSSKTLLDFFDRPSKRVKLIPSSFPSTAQMLPSVSPCKPLLSKSKPAAVAASDFSTDASSPSDLTPSQRSRIELRRLLAESRRNLKICSDKISQRRKDEGVAYVKLDELLVEETWRDVLLGELEKPYAQSLCKFLESEMRSGIDGSIGNTAIYPPQPYIFNALNSTPFDRVKAVILGQDPYHGPGQAMGLSFSVPIGVKPPSSLINIFKELQQDIGCPIPSHGNLEKWAVQGVLLLNAVLTVRSHQANSHAKKGWEQFTDAVIKNISEKKEGVVFLLWGNSAQAKLRLIDEAKHHILKAAHPSGLSANRGFFGCRHFSRTNLILEKMGIDPIDWQL